MLKIFKSTTKSHVSIMRNEESGWPVKLSKINKNYKLKFLADSQLSTSSRITLRLKNSYQVKVHRGLFFLFLVEKDYKWKGLF